MAALNLLEEQFGTARLTEVPSAVVEVKGFDFMAHLPQRNREEETHRLDGLAAVISLGNDAKNTHGGYPARR